MVKKCLLGIMWFCTSLSVANPSNDVAGKSALTRADAGLDANYLVLEAGGYWSHQGSSQHVDIAGLIGDTFTVSKHRGANGLLGLGYYFAGQENGGFQISYGLNGFYLLPTDVSGVVIQEDLYSNLSYRYRVTHYPLYGVIKSTIGLGDFNKTALTLDAGIGPNFMRAHHFSEQSLDNGVTLADGIFSSHTSTTLSATAGVGLRLGEVLGSTPLECGYRFMYLGKGRFARQTEQVGNALHTGTGYAHALICSVSI